MYSQINRHETARHETRDKQSLASRVPKSRVNKQLNKSKIG